eukprot:501506_1
MDTFPQKIQDFIIDHQQFYGKIFWITDYLDEDALKKFIDDDQHPLLCAYMPMIIKQVEFAACGYVVLPYIYQGIHGPLEIYREPSIDRLLNLMINEYENALSDPNVRTMYSTNELKLIKQRFNAYHEQEIHIEKGYLVKLKEETVPFAKQYPIARVCEIRKRSNGQPNIRIIHQKVNKNKIMDVRKSGGWIFKASIDCVLSDSTNRIAHFAAYTREVLIKTKQRKKELKHQYKVNKTNKFNRIMYDYLGQKVRDCLNEQNFKNTKKKLYTSTVEQDVDKCDITDTCIPKLKEKSISFTNNKSKLNIKIANAKEMGIVIGRQNVFKIKNGFEYFIEYPVQIEYGYQWKFPRFKIEFNVKKLNRAANFER